MSFKHVASNSLHCLRIGLATLAMFQFTVGASLASAAPTPAPAQEASAAPATASPIKHVIVIIGENRSFDHVFATYVPKGKPENLELALGRNRQLGRHPRTELPHRAADRATVNGDQVFAIVFLLSPPKTEFPRRPYFPPRSSEVRRTPTSKATACRWRSHRKTDAAHRLLSVSDFRRHGLDFAHSGHSHHQRQFASGRAVSVDQRQHSSPTTPTPPARFTASTRCGSSSIAPRQRHCDNPSGCDANLFSWVEVTVGAGTNGLAQPANFSTEYSPSATTTGEGSTALGFYNVQNGDAPYFK